ncbi:MAG: T9SS type A sorting domain-containing protein [Saprospiraceae bacterium]|nr:T9SS type A sorting domain-containing protein [Saprospiraceae bacterium]
MNLTELNNGIYFLKLMDKNKNYIQKLIKISN